MVVSEKLTAELHFRLATVSVVQHDPTGCHVLSPWDAVSADHPLDGDERVSPHRPGEARNNGKPSAVDRMCVLDGNGVLTAVRRAL